MLRSRRLLIKCLLVGFPFCSSVLAGEWTGQSSAMSLINFPEGQSPNKAAQFFEILPKAVKLWEEWIKHEVDESYRERLRPVAGRLQDRLNQLLASVRSLDQSTKGRRVDASRVVANAEHIESDINEIQSVLRGVQVELTNRLPSDSKLPGQLEQLIAYRGFVAKQIVTETLQGGSPDLKLLRIRTHILLVSTKEAVDTAAKIVRLLQ